MTGGTTEEIYGTQTSGISGSIGTTSGKMKGNLTGSNFYQPHDELKIDNTRNRESGTMGGTSPNVKSEQPNENVRNIDEEIPISLNAGMIGGGHPDNFDDLPTNHLN